MYEVAVRVYMLHLVECNIIADKSQVYIDAIIYTCLLTLNLSIVHEVVLL